MFSSIQQIHPPDAEILAVQANLLPGEFRIPDKKL
jgi:hypothetical protein